MHLYGLRFDACSFRLRSAFRFRTSCVLDFSLFSLWRFLVAVIPHSALYMIYLLLSQQKLRQESLARSPPGHRRSPFPVDRISWSRSVPAASCHMHWWRVHFGSFYTYIAQKLNEHVIYQRMG